MESTRNSSGSGDHRTTSKKVRVALWTIQVLLALVFVFAGVMKLVLPAEAMKGPIAFPTVFLRFIGVCEVLGAIGLIVPGLVRIRTELTPIAALGLVLIMIGATTTTAATMPIGMAVPPFVVGVLAAIVAYARWQPLTHTNDRQIDWRAQRS